MNSYAVFNLAHVPDLLVFLYKLLCRYSIKAYYITIVQIVVYHRSIHASLLD